MLSLEHVCFGVFAQIAEVDLISLWGDTRGQEQFPPCSSLNDSSTMTQMMARAKQLGHLFLDGNDNQQITSVWVGLPNPQMMVLRRWFRALS